MDLVRFKKCFAAALLGAAAILAIGAVPRDSAVIVNSGSTNTAGYRIEVWNDGSASVATQQRFASPGPAKSFTVPPETVKRFFADLAAARKGNAATLPCMKSASFGSTTTITWQGWSSPDLNCPPKDSLGSSLVTDIETIRKASGVTGSTLLH